MKYTIHGVEVDFPFEAYPCQIQFMESNIKALMGGMNAILESPTGTGKTLCLLCSTLAYQQHLRQKEGGSFRIYYSSRTHSQLSQVIKELRGTVYHDEVRTSVLGSRDQLCVEPVVNQHRGAMLNSQCRRLLRSKACSYNNKVTRASGPEAAPMLANCADIEDLYNLGSAKGFCPFFQSRETVKTADIVFVPYNYIVDFRENTGEEENKIDLAGSVVIIDEAHNLERVCEDAATLTFGTLDIHNTLKSINRALEDIAQERQTVTNGDDRKETLPGIQSLNSTERSLMELAKVLRNVDHLLTKFELTGTDNSGRRERGISGQDFVSVFVTSGCNRGNYKSYLQAIEEIQERSMDDASFAAYCLQNIRDVLSLLFGGVETGRELDEYFRAFVQAGDTRPGGNAGELGIDARVISLYCLSASIAMKGLVEKKKVRNIILASGTLSPLGLLQSSLGIPFGVVLQNTHVIDTAKQVLVGVVCTGPARVALNGSYQNKGNPEYLNDLGNLVVNICRVAPEGALLVFHAYSQMSLAIRTWQENGIYSRINREKTVFVEPRNAGELTEVMQQFEATTLSNTGGAVLFCVCRGKVTEGVDLADNQCRLVMMAGVPYPATQDRKVILKREFLDSKNRGDGGKWYVQEAARTVNQTIGRAIRHRNDYGSILLLDERYRSYVGTDSLPGWVQGHVKMYPQFGPVVKDVTDFFRNISPDLRPAYKSSNRSLSRNNSLNLSGDPTWNAEKQIESIQRLISSVPTAQRVLKPLATKMPATSSNHENAFKVSAPIAARPLARKATDSGMASAVNQNPSASPIAWILKMKATLNRTDYVLLKQQLRRLLEGAHGQCDVTVTETLAVLKDLLTKAKMVDSFEPIIAGSNGMLKRKWEQIHCRPENFRQPN